MSEAESLTMKDRLLVAILSAAGCKTDVKSFKDLASDPKALEVYQSKTTLKRGVYQNWPRDSNGDLKKMSSANDCVGKMTSNMIPLWGATLWDFFWVPRNPDLPGNLSVSTSSKLEKWMTKHGEVKRAANEITWAQREENPREIFPYPISGVIEAQEMKIRLGLCGISLPIDEENDTDSGKFGAESYPEPWPLIPFSYRAAKLEQRIPLHQLPKKLIVHDPYGLLSVSSSAYGYSRKYPEGDDWTSLEDVKYVYNLSLRYSGKQRIEKELEAEEQKSLRRAERQEALRAHAVDTIPDGFDGFLIVPTSVSPGPTEPLILALHEAAPDPEPIEEAHLYLSAKEIVGEGNHSLIANAEWEIPRSLLVPPTLCDECITDEVRRALVASDGIDRSKKAEIWKEKSGCWKEYKSSEATTTVITAVESTELEHPESCETKYLYYTGPLRTIKTNVKWHRGEGGPYCSHVLRRLHVDSAATAPHPPTAKVTVVAKLSKQGDSHLSNEADQYEEFPQYLSEHWNGYNVIPPLKAPVPVGAVVPQYYGYYTVEGKGDPCPGYLSPVMLLENCGQGPLRTWELSRDDKYECKALFYRFHEAGYLQASVYSRNVVWQKGPIDRPEYQRGTGQFTEDGRKNSFRLIDFGRAYKYYSSRECSREKECVAEMIKYGR